MLCLATWDRLTRRCVLLSAALLALSFTPIATSPAVPAGHVVQSLPAWTDTLQSAFAFTVLVTVFAADRETEATLLHAVGAAGQLSALLQAFQAGAMPVTAVLLCVCLALAAVLFNCAQVSGLFDSLETAGAAAWARWQAFLGCVGLALVPQALALAFAPASWAAAPAVTGAAVGIAVTAAVTQASVSPAGVCADASPADQRSADKRAGAGSAIYGTPSRGGSAKGRSASGQDGGDGGSGDGEHGLGRWQPFWATVPAWTATLLLMLEPVKLLVGHAAGQSSLAGAGIAAPALTCIGNALLVPRALRLCNGMFLTATTWGTAGAWLVMAASLGGRQAGMRAWAVFSGYTALLVVFGWRVRRCHLAARRVELAVASCKRAAGWFVEPPITRILRSGMS